MLAALLAAPLATIAAHGVGASARFAQPISAERCFGAASRDARKPCSNPRLRLAVFPRPDDALLTPNAPCSPEGATAELNPCLFGIPAGASRQTVALLGDSHASHWRAAVQVVAEQRLWRGISVTQTSCPYSLAEALLPSRAARSGCRGFNREVPGWFAQHPEIRTVIISQHARSDVRARAGATAYATQVDGYVRAWKALPDTVRHIIVIRDVPSDAYTTSDCVRRAISDRVEASERCAVPRASAVTRDAAVGAVAQMRTSRVRLVDLTRFMCSSAQCFPVVGGALVHKDGDHLTTTFATTLGPYLARTIRSFLGPPPKRAAAR